jgi:HlyD family secretion protein
MGKRTIRQWFLGLVLALGITALLVVALIPSPLRVEVAPARRGPLVVTVDEEGETRVHDRFTIAAPVPGRLLRIELEEGDIVQKNQPVSLLDPQPLSQREREELSARLQAVEAAKRAADVRVTHARADHEQAKRDRARAERLGREGVISAQALEQAQINEETSAQDLQTAMHRAEAAAFEVGVAKASLVAIEAERGSTHQLIRLPAPVSGRVLRILEKSERIVPAGTPLMTVADPTRLEVVVDILSTDAVKVRPSASVLLEHWGGDHSIRGRVRLIEPAGFTKVSALGIEEQRVNVVIDFLDPPGPLGDGYRVDAKIIVWSAESVLKIPATAIFRRGEAWNVLTVESGRAREHQVTIGHRGATEVEILQGLNEGMQVILHPSNQIQEGGRVQPQ